MEENKKFNFSKTNIFSEGHRLMDKSKMLFDIDKLIIINGEIKGIIEEKYKIDSINFGNILKEMLPQREFLNNLSKILEIPLYVVETSTDRWFILKDNIHLACLRPIGDFLNTANTLYIEVRHPGYKPVAVFHRTENLKPPMNENIVNKLITKANIRKILVNDIFSNTKIYFQDPNLEGFLILEDYNNVLEWNEIYNKLNLL